MAINRLGIVKPKRAVFLHIPKTAGTSIVDLARLHYGQKNICSHGDFMGIEAASLIATPFVSGHFGYEFARELMPGRYSFTFLRDPIERTISFYYFCQTRNPDEFEEYRIAQENSLSRYLEMAIESKQLDSWNNQTRLLAHSRESASKFSETELLSLAKLHLDDFSYIGFTESFEQDSGVVARAMGMGPKQAGHSNVTPKRVSVDELTSNTRRLLEKVNELDIELYQYAKQRRHEREQPRRKKLAPGF